MPKTPIDFSKAVIYSIVCKTDETLIYVGSTTNFRERTYKHKSTSYNKNNKDHNTPFYVMIRANGGWENFKMTPIKEFPCENKIQLVIEEERIRVEIKAKLNTNRAYIAPDKQKEARAEKRKKYYTKNAEQIIYQYKQHYEANKQQISERKKQWYQANKERIAERSRIKYQERKKAL